MGYSTTITKLVLLDALKKFRDVYPNINIDITNDLTCNLINDLKLGKLDFVIFNESNVKETNLYLEKITELKHRFIYNPEYYNDNISSFEDLNKLPLILQKEESNSRKLLDYIALQNNIKLDPKMEVDIQVLITEFVNIGLGIVFSIIDLANRNYKRIKNKQKNTKY